MDFAAARKSMIESQVRTNGVQDAAVVAAMAAVPRELFLPKSLRGQAYLDDNLDIGAGRFLIAPLVLARMLQSASLTASDVALVVGDPTGYVTAVAARLASFVVALDSDSDSLQRAAPALAELAVDNVELVLGALAAGHPAKAPYDALLLAGSVAEIPPALPRQLADGGRLVGVVGQRRGLGRGTLMLRCGDTWGRREVFDAATPLLPGTAAPSRFVF